jgi:hypothetical protein
MNELYNKISDELNKYKYMENEQEYIKYWIEDVYEEYIIVHSYEDGELYKISWEYVNDVINLYEETKIKVEIEYVPQENDFMFNLYKRCNLADVKIYAKENDNVDVLRKVNAIYKKLGLSEDDKNGKEENMETIKEKMSVAGYMYITKDESNIYSYKEGKFYSLIIPMEGSDEIEMKYEEVDMSIKLSYADKVLDLTFEEMCNPLKSCKNSEEDDDEEIKRMESIKSEMETMKVKMEETEKKMEDMKKEMEDTVKEKQDMAKKLEEQEELVRMAKKAELTEKVEKEMEYAEILDESDKKEIMAKIEKNEYSCFDEAITDIAKKIYTKRIKTKTEFKFSVNNVTPPVVIKEDIDILAEKTGLQKK